MVMIEDYAMGTFASSRTEQPGDAEMAEKGGGMGWIRTSSKVELLFQE